MHLSPRFFMVVHSTGGLSCTLSSLVVVLQLNGRVLWLRVFLGLLKPPIKPPPAAVVVHALVLQRCCGREVS